MVNQLKTILLLGVLTVLLVWIASFFGQNAALVMLGVAFLLNFGAYWFSDRIVLAMYRAKEVTEEEAPAFYRAVRQLTTIAGLPMPRVYIYPAANPNAFATGRSPQHAAVAVSTGLLEILDENELKGVLGHELSHIKDRDILIATIAATMAAAITYLARMLQWAAFFGAGDRDQRSNPFGIIALLFMAVLAPIAALLVQMAVSRSREYLADAEGAKMCGQPHFLANALRKLDAVGRRYPLPTTNPATSHLFIVKPFTAKGLLALFSTHPPIEERIRRLENSVTER